METLRCLVRTPAAKLSYKSDDDKADHKCAQRKTLTWFCFHKNCLSGVKIYLSLSPVEGRQRFIAIEHDERNEIRITY
jgi:hypothetical protein